jgi:hypothetical protein
LGGLGEEFERRGEDLRECADFAGAREEFGMNCEEFNRVGEEFADGAEFTGTGEEFRKCWEDFNW